MYITIKVTKRDIAYGARDNCDRCPVARAIKRAVRVNDIEIFPLTLNLYDRDCSYATLAIPKVASTFIESFDGGAIRRHLKPFSFRLNVPKRFLRTVK